MSENIKSVNDQINAKLGITTECATTYEAVRAQVSKLGGDLTKVNDIYTGELQVLEHISGGAGKLQTKDVLIQDNGETIVSPDEGYDGLTSVKIDTDVQPNLQIKTTGVYENKTVTIKADEGYDGLEAAVVTVSITPNLQEKTLTIDKNSETTVSADTGYDGLENVKVTVNVPSDKVPTQEKSVSITSNGTTEVTPDDGYDLSKVNVVVDVEGGGECPLSFADINYYDADAV